MLGKRLDDLIAVFSPVAAAKRAHARSVYNSIARRNYDAARVDRMSGNPARGATASADNAMAGGQATMTRNRARDLIRNNPYAFGAIEAIVANVIGCGIQPMPRVSDDKERNAAIRDEFLEWCKVADVTRAQTHFEQQSLALTEMIVAGEMLTNFVQDESLPRTPLAIELIESERIADETNLGGFRPRTLANGNEVRRGLEVDRAGRVVAYYLYPFGGAPGDMNAFYVNPDRVAAARLLHLFKKQRIGQTRGMSWLAPVLTWIRDLGIYFENEMQAAAVSSCLTAVIKTVDGGNSFNDLNPNDGADRSDADGNRFAEFQPGMVAHLLPGEDVSFINPSRPNATAEAWINLILRSIAVGMGLSYEVVTRDYSKTDFSSNRASSLEDRRRFRPMQKFMVNHFCEPIYREWFFTTVLAKEAGRPGLEAFPSLLEFIAEPDLWTYARWQTPGWEWVDPLKEAQAAEVEIKNGLRSRTEVVTARGGDIEEVFAELQEESERAEELQITIDADQAQLEMQQEANEQQNQAKTAAAAAA